MESSCLHPASADEDRALLARYFATRSHEDFEQIVRRYIGLVYGVAVRRVRDHEAAEDVTQSVFVLLARKAGSLRKETVLGAWLVRVAQFRASEACRQERRRRDRERKAMARQIESGPADSPSSNLESEDARQILDEALAKLGGGERRAVMLRYVHGFTNRDAAGVLGISEDSCKQRVSRGLRRMRTLLEARGISAAPMAIVSALSLIDTTSAPPHLVSRIVGACNAAKSAVHAAASVPTLIKAKLTVIACASLVICGAVVFVHSSNYFSGGGFRRPIPTSLGNRNVQSPLGSANPGSAKVRTIDGRVVTVPYPGRRASTSASYVPAATHPAAEGSGR